MRKRILHLLAVTCCLLAAPMAMAEDFNASIPPMRAAIFDDDYDFAVDGIGYEILSDSTVAVAATCGCEGDVVIPSYVSYDSHNYAVTAIGVGAFHGCSLTSVTIPNTVTYIDEYAFYMSYDLASVTIPNSVTSIGEEAFYGCSSLSSIKIPSSVTYIGAWALDSTPWFDNQPVGLVYAGLVAYKYKGMTPSGTNLVIEDGTKGIAAYCFNAGDISPSGGSPMARTGLTSVVIPNSVTYIGDQAFYGCCDLEELTIPNSVTSIGSHAFSYTPWYDNQPDGLLYAGLVAYTYKGTMPSGTNIAINDGTKVIASSCFADCVGLESVVIPNSVATIGDAAFKSCTSLAGVDIPNSVTSIGDEAFSGCTSLASVEISSSLTSIGRYLFSGCNSLENVTIPNLVSSIGREAFSGCSSLLGVTIPNSVVSIEYYAFFGCSSLSEIIVDSGNPKYDSRSECNAIIETESNTLILGCKNSTIPPSVTAIGDEAFNGCIGLASVTIPNSVTSIGDEAFSGCSSLGAIIVESGNPKYDSRNGCNAIIETETNTLILGCKNSTIPNTVTTIGDAAFIDCIGLTSMTIPNSVITIGSSAFARCANLVSVLIPNSILTISERAFNNCVNLVSIKSHIIHPENVDVWFWPNTHGRYDSFSPNTNATLYVPKGTIDAYREHAAWSYWFVNIEEFDDNVTGDLNDDGVVDVDDLNIIINIMVHKAEPTEAADVNGDGTVDVDDLNRVINIMVHKE